MIPPTPKHLDRSERRIRIAALREISFASIIEKDKAAQEQQMIDVYELKCGDIPGSDWVQVSKDDWIKAERSAGFRPKLASDHPDYMRTCATGGFGSGRGTEGRIRRTEAPHQNEGDGHE